MSSSTSSSVSVAEWSHGDWSVPVANAAKLALNILLLAEKQLTAGGGAGSGALPPFSASASFVAKAQHTHQHPAGGEKGGGTASRATSRHASVV